jgi:hypothetical protein
MERACIPKSKPSTKIAIIQMPSNGTAIVLAVQVRGRAGRSGHYELWNHPVKYLSGKAPSLRLCDPHPLYRESLLYKVEGY